MAQASATEILGDTWIFKQVDGAITLREVALIEAVREHKNALVLPSLSRARGDAYRAPGAESYMDRA